MAAFRFLPISPAARWYGLGLLTLTVALVSAWGLMRADIAEIRRQVQDAQEAAMTEARTLIEADLDDLLQTMEEQAQRWAQDPLVRQGLRARIQGPEASQNILVPYLSAARMGPGESVELYDPTPRLLAWAGFSMPLDAATEAAHFLERPTMAVAQDGDQRTAFALWWPVRDGDEVVGVVRLLRRVEQRTPVQNEYLRDLSLARRWSRDTQLQVRVSLDGPWPREAPAGWTRRVLQGLDGSVLGIAEVAPPSPERLVRQAQDRGHNLIAFWAVLLWAWGVGGLWLLYRQARRLGLRLASWLLLALAWWGGRYLLIALHVPGRWQPGRAPLSPLFDPAHLASSLAGGLFQSLGDLILTAFFAALFGLALMHLAFPLRARAQRLLRPSARLARVPERLRWWLLLGSLVTVGAGLHLVLAAIVRRLVLDSTLDYLTQRGLLPDTLTLLSFSAVLLLAVASLLILVGLSWLVLGLVRRPRAYGRRFEHIVAWMAWTAVLTTLYAALTGPTALGVAGPYTVLPWYLLAGLLLTSGALVVGSLQRWEDALDGLRLRPVLLGTLALTSLLYPVLYEAVAERDRAQMQEASFSFDEGRDPRVVFGMEQVLSEAQDSETVRRLLTTSLPPDGLTRLAAQWLDDAFLTTLGNYDLTLSFFDPSGAVLGAFSDAANTRPTVATRDAEEPLPFDLVRQMYGESGATGVFVEPMTGAQEPDRLEYQGLVPVRTTDGLSQAGWVGLRAIPRAQSAQPGAAFPRVLLPGGYQSSLYDDVSVAAFREGILTRSTGREFGRHRLPESTIRQVLRARTLWLREDVKGQPYLTFYRLILPQDVLLNPSRFEAQLQIVAVRTRAVTVFDHLYFLLRMLSGALLLSIPLYLAGVFLRYRTGLLPAERVRFSDRVLNAFLGVGVVTVALVGLVGLQVVTAENERAVQRLLRQHLERVEDTLQLESEPGERPYQTLDRIGLNQLGARVGLDLNLYRQEELVTSSRPRLVRERLVDPRLPIDVYQALYFDGFRFTYDEAFIGTLPYTAGYRALYDERGQTRYVLSVPTLPEQERLEEERARTVAYLFGGLLLLILMVLLTAGLLASALSRPIQRLRAGLESVGKGEVAQPLPVETRDEVGDLVRTFNGMQRQLVESRSQLAQQERQLAWREMARQVAHEIKNPLTPLKLSVQHLQRAYAQEHRGDGAPQSRFGALFQRITTTLIEQIDTLARIANDFSTFAQLPRRVLEEIDVNTIIREAVTLMQEEATVEIGLDLHPAPLHVEADHEELRRIYINLIKNALQALPEGNGRVMVTTHYETSQPHGEGHGWVHSAVTDTGTGIPAELQARIFEPNFSTKTSGTGLGLAITQKGVEAMGGTITFDTEEGTGTTFWLRFPLVAPVGVEV
ncbi:MAG: ATP-binding protein [Bacteroidota bacterium]